MSPRGRVAVARRFASQLGWIARDALAGRRSLGGIPNHLDAVDATWLGEALSERFPGTAVARTERIGEHRGTTARARLRLEYARAPRDEAPPNTVFVKLAPPDVATKIFTGAMQLGRTEVALYRSLGAELPVEVPRVFCARAAPRAGRFALVLEDLVAGGCAFPGFETRLGAEEARAVVTALARLHAAYWETPRAGRDLAWLRRAETNRNAAVERWLSARSQAPALSRVREGIPERVRRDAHRIHERRERLEAYWARPPRTLLHGDTHVGNLYFRGPGPEGVGLLDWQLAQWGPGIRDVGYFLISSLDSELRRAHQRELVELYLSELARCGVPDPDPGDTWQRYRTVALYTWIASAVTVALGGLQSEAIGRLALRRSGAAIEDLDALAALDELPAGDVTPPAAGVGAAARAGRR